MHLGQCFCLGMNFDNGAQSSTVGACAFQLYLAPVNRFTVGEIAYQNHGAVIEFVGHDVKIAIIIEIENDGAACAQEAKCTPAT